MTPTMTSSEVLAPLAERPVEDLVADLERLREVLALAERKAVQAQAELRQLQVDERVLAQLVDWARLRADGAAEAAKRARHGLSQAVSEQASSQPELAMGVPMSSFAPAWPAKDTSVNTPTRLVRIMRAHPDRASWSPPELGAELAREGQPVDSNTVRVALRRMAKRGDIERSDDGRYRLGPEGPTDTGGA
jgi:hypothetical protein